MRPVVAIPLLSLIPFPILSQDRPVGTRLDSTPVQLNRAGAKFPEAPDVESLRSAERKAKRGHFRFWHQLAILAALEEMAAM